MLTFCPFWGNTTNGHRHGLEGAAQTDVHPRASGNRQDHHGHRDHLRVDCHGQGPHLGHCLLQQGYAVVRMQREDGFSTPDPPPQTGGEGAFGKWAQLTGPLISYFELWRQRRRKFFWGVENGQTSPRKKNNMVNDDFSEPPRRADSKNLIFIFSRILGPGHLRGPGVSIGTIFGVPLIEPLWRGSSQRAVSTPPSKLAHPRHPQRPPPSCHIPRHPSPRFSARAGVPAGSSSVPGHDCPVLRPCLPDSAAAFRCWTWAQASTSTCLSPAFDGLLALAWLLPLARRSSCTILLFVAGRPSRRCGMWQAVHIGLFSICEGSKRFVGGMGTGAACDSIVVPSTCTRTSSPGVFRSLWYRSVLTATGCGRKARLCTKGRPGRTKA